MTYFCDRQMPFSANRPEERVLKAASPHSTAPLPRAVFSQPTRREGTESLPRRVDEPDFGGLFFQPTDPKRGY